jgi:hypothetical protein
MAFGSTTMRLARNSNRKEWTSGFHIRFGPRSTTTLLPGWRRMMSPQVVVGVPRRNYRGNSFEDSHHDDDDGGDGPMVLTMFPKSQFPPRSTRSMFKEDCRTLDPPPVPADVKALWRHSYLLRAIYKQKEVTKKSASYPVGFVLLPHIAQVSRSSRSTNKQQQYQTGERLLLKKPVRPRAPRNAWDILQDDCKGLDSGMPPHDRVVKLWKNPTFRRLCEKRAQDEEEAYKLKIEEYKAAMEAYKRGMK